MSPPTCVTVPASPSGPCRRAAWEGAGTCVGRVVGGRISGRWGSGAAARRVAAGTDDAVRTTNTMLQARRSTAPNAQAWPPDPRLLSHVRHNRNQSPRTGSPMHVALRVIEHQRHVQGVLGRQWRALAIIATGTRDGAGTGAGASARGGAGTGAGAVSTVANGGAAAAVYDGGVVSGRAEALHDVDCRQRAATGALDGAGPAGCLGRRLGRPRVGQRGPLKENVVDCGGGRGR